MPKDILNEREFELINIVGAQLAFNQRDLSRHLELSLGLTNMLVKRLVAKGYIRITQLNKRKVQYILTPKGFAEKMRKSVKYTLKTINSIGLIKDKMKNIVAHLYKEGERTFVVLGKSDFAHLVETACHDLALTDCRIIYTNDVPIQRVEGTLLICREKVQVPAAIAPKTIDVVQELAKDESFINYVGETA